MATAGDLIKRSLKLIGAISQSETPSSSEQSDGLDSLNDLIESWSAESLVIYSVTRETFSTVASQQTYTIGSSGDINTTRPQKIVKAILRQQNSPVYDVEIDLINLDQWESLGTKDTESSIPTKLYNDCGYPLSTLYLWPIPSEVKTIILHSWKPLTSFSATTDSISLPPGYMRALRYNLAVDLAPEYGISIAPEIAQIAQESKANIKRMNKKPRYLLSDPALSRGGGFDYRTGE